MDRLNLDHRDIHRSVLHLLRLLLKVRTPKLTQVGVTGRTMRSGWQVACATAAFAATAVAGGCATKEIYLPDGQKGHSISCNSQGQFGGLVDWSTCYQHASNLCGARGYTVLQRSDQQGFSASVSQYSGYAGTTTDRMMVIKCNDGAAPVPTAPAKQQ